MGGSQCYANQFYLVCPFTSYLRSEFRGRWLESGILYKADSYGMAMEADVENGMMFCTQPSPLDVSVVANSALECGLQKAKV